MKKVVKIESTMSMSCPACGSFLFDSSRMDDAINHVIENHDGKILHVGQESEGYVENAYQKTVAVVEYEE